VLTGASAADDTATIAKTAQRRLAFPDNCELLKVFS